MNTNFVMLGQQGIQIPSCVQPAHLAKFQQVVGTFNEEAERAHPFGHLIVDDVPQDVVEGLSKLCNMHRLKNRIRKIFGHQVFHFTFA